MSQRLAPVGLVLASLTLLGGCLTTRERVLVHRDGSLTVRLEARGHPHDFGDGYPIPLGGPWRPANEPTRRFAGEIGTDTGSAATHRNVEESAWLRDLKEREQDLTLAVEARFASAAALPRSYAAASDPYAGAYLERSTDLGVETRSGRAVYVFERVFHRRSGLADRLWDLALEPVEELKDKVEDAVRLTDGEVQRGVDALQRAFLDVAGAYARESLGALYVEGDASLPLAARSAVLERVRRGVAALIGRERLARGIRKTEELVHASKRGEDTDVQESFVETIEREVRDAVRTGLRAGLEESGVAAGLANGVMHRYEWLLTAHDHTDDLADESFEITVEMPGVVVSGNFHALDGSAASWKFGGKDLVDRDVVLRVVSVVE